MTESLRLERTVESKLPIVVSLDKTGALLEYRGIQVENVLNDDGESELVFSYKEGSSGGYSTERVAVSKLKADGMFIVKAQNAIPVVFMLDDDGDLVFGTEKMMERYDPEKAVYSRGLSDEEMWNFAASRATRTALTMFGGYALLRILGLPSCMEFSSIDESDLEGIIDPVHLDIVITMLIVFGTYAFSSNVYYNSSWMKNLRFSTAEAELDEHTFLGFVASACSTATRNSFFACALAFESLMDTIGRSSVGGPHIPSTAVEALDQNQGSIPDPIVYGHDSWGVPGGTGAYLGRHNIISGTLFPLTSTQMRVPASKIQRCGELLAEVDGDGFEVGERYVGPFTTAEEKVATDNADSRVTDLGIELVLPEEEPEVVEVEEEVVEEVTENA